jgi:hypothetical protein
LKPDEVPVLFEITNLDEDGWNYFILDSKDYSLFDYEKEVLLLSGDWFNIVDI